MPISPWAQPIHRGDYFNTSQNLVEFVGRELGVIFNNPNEVQNLFDTYQKLVYYDRLTALHSREVAVLSVLLGSSLVPQEQWGELFWGGLLHDLGKLSFSDDMNMGGQLTIEQLEIIKEHPQIGYELLDSMTSSSIIKDMVLHHHENVDGTGYFRLKEDQLSVYARIIRISDMFSALTSFRPYRFTPMHSTQEALHIMKQHQNDFDIGLLNRLTQAVQRSDDETFLLHLSQPSKNAC